MKISILSSSLSSNCFGRAYVLAKVLQRRYDIEIIGPTYGGGIWPPCDRGEFEIKSFEGVCPRKLFPALLKKVLNLIQGDVIYAVKPLLMSYGLALTKRATSRVPVVLDIDDWQLAFTTRMDGLFDIKRLRARLSGLGTSPNSYYWVALMDRLIPLADDLTTVSSFLKNKYGDRAVIVPHGRDSSLFNPDLYDRQALRRSRGLDQLKVITFLGTPRSHKGIEDIVGAVKLLRRHDIKILIVGVDEDNRFVRGIEQDNEDLIITHGMVPFEQIPIFLAMADLVVIAQKKEPKTAGQIPAKLIDAMAMAKPIIATDVSDMAQILNDCGIVVEAGNLEALASNIDLLLNDECLALGLGSQSRAKFLRELSFDCMESGLAEVFEKYASNHRRNFGVFSRRKIERGADALS